MKIISYKPKWVEPETMALLNLVPAGEGDGILRFMGTIGKSHPIEMFIDTEHKPNMARNRVEIKYNSLPLFRGYIKSFNQLKMVLDLLT